MKTVITDNSLCTLPIYEGAKPEHIYKYIEALAETGVRFCEIDFRTVMKMNELPESMNYIFRLGNPMFAELAEVFDFSYVLVTINDFKERLKIKNTPVIMEFPAVSKLSRQMVALAQHQIPSRIEMVRLRGSYQYMTPTDAAQYVLAAKNAVPVPIDICPMNKAKTALDMALKFSRANVDSLTMCMGLSQNYASLEEFLFTLMSVHETLPKDFNMAALCKAAIYHQLVFGPHSSDSISYIMHLLDQDILSLRNADTGSRVRMRVQLKDKMLLQKSFVSALENFINNEEIPEDFAIDIYDAIKRFDTTLYNTDLSYTYSKEPMN